MKDFYATHVMTDDPVVVKPVMRVGDLVHMLSSNQHNAFPVVDTSMSVHPRYTVQASAADERELQKGVLKAGRGLFLGLVLRKVRTCQCLHACVLYTRARVGSCVVLFDA